MVRPNVLHGPPAYIGVVEWSRRLWGFERVVREVANVPGDFAECGVFYGYGILVMLHLAGHGGQPRHIYGFDSFAGHPAAADADKSTPQSEDLHDFWRVTQDDVWKTLTLGTDFDAPAESLRRQVTLVPGFFSESMPKFQGGPFAFIHLDPDYYESTRDVLKYLWPKLNLGGVVLFGQLDNPTLPGKGVAIREFLAATAPGTVEMCLDKPSGHYFLRKLG